MRRRKYRTLVSGDYTDTRPSTGALTSNTQRLLEGHSEVCSYGKERQLYLLGLVYLV